MPQTTSQASKVLALKRPPALLQEFGTLDNMLAHPEKVKGDKKQEILRTQQKEALMSRELATLNTKVEVPQDVRILSHQSNRQTATC